MNKEYLKSEIDLLINEYSMPNWDGYGAEALKKNISKNLKELIDLFPNKVKLPSVTPSPDGTIDLDWDEGKNIILSLSLQPDLNYLSWAAIIYQDKIHGISYSINQIPFVVMCILEKFFSEL